MNLVVLGGPVAGKINIEITPDKPFGHIFVSIQEAVGDGQLWEKFQLHVAEIRDRKARPTARVIQSEDTAKSLGLPSSAPVVVLRPLNQPSLTRSSTAADVSSALGVSSTASGRSDYRRRILAIYQKYEPSKVGTVDATLRKFSGKEEAVIRQLVKKYGPEPEDVVGSEEVPQPPVSEALPETVFPDPASNKNGNSSGVTDYHEVLVSIYQKYDPSKLGSVSATLKKFKGKEEAVIQKLLKKYGAEMPVKANTPASGSPTSNLPPAPASSSEQQPSATPSLVLETKAAAVAVAKTTEGEVTSPTTDVYSESEGKSFRRRILAIYQKYEPSKVGTVDATLRKFSGKEEAVIRQLVKKYGPEPEDVVEEKSLQHSTQDANNLLVAHVSASSNVPDFKKSVKEAVAVVSKSEYAQNAACELSSEPLTTARSKPEENTTLESSSRTESVPSVVPLENNKPRAELRDLQPFKYFVKPEPLSEPPSDAEENSAFSEREMTGSGGNKWGEAPKNLSLRKATAILEQDSFDTKKPLLRDLDRPALSIQQHSLITRKEEEEGSITANPRVRCILERAVGLFNDVISDSLRRVYWKKWQYKVAQNMASDLLDRKIWAKTDDGVKLVDSVPHIYSVPDLDHYMFERRICVRRNNVDFSDDLQKALRELLYIAKQYLADTEEAEEMPLLRDKELCPVRDTKRLAMALSTVTNVVKSFIETKRKLELKEREIAKLMDVNKELRAMLNETESTRLRLTGAEERVCVLQTQCKTLEEQLKKTQGELTAAHYQIQHFQREHKGENNILESDMERLIQQKDSSLASLQRELAKVRSKLHSEQEKNKAMTLKLEEVQRTSMRGKNKLQKRSPSSLLDNRKRFTRGVSSRLSIPKGAFSSLSVAKKKTEKISDEDFFPYEPAKFAKDGGDKSLAEEMTDTDLVRENLRLESELRTLQCASEECSFGNCPHCMLQLTSCSSALTGPPDSKAAFCFSCRKSYTFSDLLLLNTKKKKGNFHKSLTEVM